MPEMTQAIWRWSLAAGCFAAAMWMKWSGVDDAQSNDPSGRSDDGHRLQHGGQHLRGAPGHHAADARPTRPLEAGQKNEDGQVIDFHAVRSARALHRWARERDMRTRTEVKT